MATVAAAPADFVSGGRRCFVAKIEWNAIATAKIERVVVHFLRVVGMPRRKSDETGRDQRGRLMKRWRRAA
jgi:hypothetical protein